MADDDQKSSQAHAAAQRSDIPETASPPPFKDRRTGLIVFGVVQILMGACFAMLIPLMLLSVRVGAAGGAATSMRMMIPAIGVYAPLAVALVWVGIGSILARRWARALTLVAAWMALVIGVFSLIMFSVVMPKMFTAMEAGREMPPGAARVFQVVMFGTLGFMYIVLPGAFVLFYRSPHVKATCEAADPHIRWTDRCPLPVLALSLLLAFGSLSMLMTLSYGGVLPLFGTLMTGVPAIIASLAIGVLFAYLAWGTYKLKMSSWWTSLIAYALFMLSSVITFSRIDLMDMYRAMNFTEEQLKVMQQSGIIDRMNMPVMMGIGFVAIMGYLLWVRRYFVAGSASPPG